MQCWRGSGLLTSTPFVRWLISRNSCTKLFIGGLSYDTNEPVLKEAFKSHGEILEVKVICHHVTGKSKGYGFVQFTCEKAASTALKEMDGQVLFYWMVETFAFSMHTRARCEFSCYVEYSLHDFRFAKTSEWSRSKNYQPIMMTQGLGEVVDCPPAPEIQLPMS